MAYTKPFFRHTHHVTSLITQSPEPGRYPYHNRTECPVGQRVKKSGEWQYYLGRRGEERPLCAQCAELGSIPAGEATSTAPVA